MDSQKLIDALSTLNNTIKEASKPKSGGKSNASLLAGINFSSEEMEKQNKFLRENKSLLDELNMSESERVSYYKEMGSYVDKVNESYGELTTTTEKVNKLSKDFYDMALKYPKKIGDSINKNITAKFAKIKNGWKDVVRQRNIALAQIEKSNGGMFAKGLIYTKMFAKISGRLLGPVGMALKALGGAMISIFVNAIKYGTKFVKFMTALPLVITTKAAKGVWQARG